MTCDNDLSPPVDELDLERERRENGFVHADASGADERLAGVA